MARVALITRAFNRLEYTALCIRECMDKAGIEYDHIVINQASTDGTKEFLNSLVQENYYPIKVIHNASNSGDAGGMKDGFSMLSDDCEYVLQMDNDLRPVTDGFLKQLVEMMDKEPKLGCLTPKRTKVQNVIDSPDTFEWMGHTLFPCKSINYGLMRISLLRKINHWRREGNIGWGFAVTAKMHEMGYDILKCKTILIEHIDGFEDGNILQKDKYPKYFEGIAAYGTNYTKVDYS